MFDDAAHMPLERLEHEITRLAAHVNAGMCRWLELVAEFDRREGWAGWTGCGSSAEWVAWRCSLEPRAAREHVRVARRLGELPRIHAGFRGGRLSYSKVRALTRVAEPGSEADLIELAEHATAAQLERVCSALRRVSAREANEVHENRFLTWFWEDDGSLSIHGSLAPEDGARLLAAIDAAHGRLRASGQAAADADGAGVGDPGSAEPRAVAEGRGSAEPRAVAEDGGPAEPREPRRATNADALVAVAEASLAAGEPPGRPAELVVHVDVGSLTARGEPEGAAADARRCHLEHGPALAPETARRLGCEAALVSVPERDGEPLSVGRRTRSVPAAIKRALAARDGTCTFPGCENRLGLDAHHVRHWADGGETSLENLVHLCRRHHRLLHEGGYSMEHSPDGELRFRDPRGSRIHAAPELPRADGAHLRRWAGDRATPWPGSGERLDLGHTVSVLADRR